MNVSATQSAPSEGEPDLGYALVKPTLSSIEYMPVRVIRKTKRFAWVRTPAGKEWRYTARGLWDGFATEDEAYAEIEKMRAALSKAVRP